MVLDHQQIYYKSRLFLPAADTVLSCLALSLSEISIQDRAVVPSPDEIFATVFIIMEGSKVMPVTTSNDKTVFRLLTQNC